MQFSAITISALFGALAIANPVVRRETTEDITITGLSVRNIDSAINAASFNVQPDNVNCTGTAPAFTSTIICDDNAWSFYLTENTDIADTISDYSLTVYKEVAAFAGIYNQVNASLICRAGGSSATDFVCDQLPIQTISMTLTPTGPN